MRLLSLKTCITIYTLIFFSTNINALTYHYKIENLSSKPYYAKSMGKNKQISIPSNGGTGKIDYKITKGIHKSVGDKVFVEDTLAITKEKNSSSVYCLYKISTNVYYGMTANETGHDTLKVNSSSNNCGIRINNNKDIYIRIKPNN